MLWRRQDLSSFLCWLKQRILLPSREAAPVVSHSGVLCLPLCKTFPNLTTESPVERELSQGGQANLSHSPSSLLSFLSAQLLRAALPREGQDLGSCRDCLSSALPVTPCLPLPCSHCPPHQLAHRARKTEECSRRSMALGLD